MGRGRKARGKEIKTERSEKGAGKRDGVFQGEKERSKGK